MMYLFMKVKARLTHIGDLDVRGLNLRQSKKVSVAEPLAGSASSPNLSN